MLLQYDHKIGKICYILKRKKMLYRKSQNVQESNGIKLPVAR